MSRAARFVLTCGIFHVIVTALCVWAARRWQAAARGERRSWLVPRLRLALTLVPAIGAAAALCSLIGPSGGFTVLRLLAQALFGEVLLLTAFIAATEWRISRWRGAAAFLVVLALLASYAEGYHLGPHRLQVQWHSVPGAGADDRRTLRVLHLSDLQADRITEYERSALERARALRPDLVVWTGDFVHPRLAPTRAETTRALRSLLAAERMGRLGHFAVGGDVDMDWPAQVAGTGVVPLTDESVGVPLPGGRILRLIGLGAGTSRGHDRRQVERVITAAGPADLTIVAGHQPNFVPFLPRSAVVDLVLAGHTHGGQVALPLIGAPYTKSRLPRRYARGLNWFEGVPLHVSAGIGMERGTAPQVRFLCPPEICLLEVGY